MPLDSATHHHDRTALRPMLVHQERVGDERERERELTFDLNL